MLKIFLYQQIQFLDANSPIIEQFVHLHDYIIVFIVGIRLYVGLLLFTILNQKNIALVVYELRFLEAFWTVIPIRILVFIGLPSISLLYISDEYLPESIIIKVTGHQWYWTYDFWNIFKHSSENTSDSKDQFSQFLTETANLNQGIPRLLDTSSDLVLPRKTRFQVLVSSQDVLHSWTIPNIGIKVDAVPGRINSTRFCPLLEGVFYGQCSEICGRYHRFMPIRVHIVNLSDFIKFIVNY